MNRTAAATLATFIALSVGPLHAADMDKRVLSAQKAFVVAADPLGDDKPVASCLARHLSDQTPLTPVSSKDEADIIVRVSSHLPSATTRMMVGMMGGTPSAHAFVEAPDGTKLWDDGAKLRRAIGKFGKLDSADGDATVYCGLADELLNTMRTAMRKARGTQR